MLANEIAEQDLSQNLSMEEPDNGDMIQHDHPYV